MMALMLSAAFDVGRQPRAVSALNPMCHVVRIDRARQSHEAHHHKCQRDQEMPHELASFRAHIMRAVHARVNLCWGLRADEVG